MDIETWRHETETETQAILLNPIYCLLIGQTEVCRLSVVDEESNGSYPFVN
jgi:hypothetical protein